MSVIRRLQIIGSVIVGSAAAGGVAGLLVAALMFAARNGATSANTVRELVALGSQTGMLFGVLLGPPIVLGFLRRVPIGRLAISTLLGTAYGGMLGFTASLVFPQPRPAIPFIIGASIIGFSIAAIRLRWRFHRAERPATVESAS